MKSYTSYPIAIEHTEMTVESYLKQVANCSGRKIQRLTRTKGFLLNGKPTFLQKKLKPGDVLKVLIMEDTGFGVIPEQGTVDILYEDEYLLVVNKPARQLVHPTGKTRGGTLANFLAFHQQQQGTVNTIRAVHRLDRDTTGCILFAKDSSSQFIMAQQLSEGILKRTYLALVRGIVTPSSGVINAPIGPHPALANRRAIHEQGEPAVTNYRVTRTFSNASLLELSLDTGRTHQIRVHLAYLGYPIIGDSMYGVQVPWMKRQALHAASIRFNQIKKAEELMVHAPLPNDFVNAINTASHE